MVLFLHNTSQVEDEPYPTLLKEKGFRGFPSLCFMDAEGNVLLSHPPRSVEGFRDLKNVIALRAKGDKLTAAEHKELFLAELRTNQLERKDVQPRADKLTLSEQEKAFVATKLVDMEVGEIMRNAREAGPEKTGEALASLLAAGKTPSAENTQFWAGVLGYASTQKDAKLAQRAYDVLEKQHGSDKRYERAFERWKKQLEDANSQ